MQVVFLIISILVVIGAVIGFVRSPKMTRAKASRRQMAIAVFQMMLCGSFFALSMSDFLDIGVDYSIPRFIIMTMYDAVFLMLIIYVVGFSNSRNSQFLKVVIYACIILMIAQTFIFPYGSEEAIKRGFELAAGIAVIVLLATLVWKMRVERVGTICLLAIIVIELIVAIWNVIMPVGFVINDIDPSDIPLNYVMLFMRPVLFSSLSVVYRAWLDKNGLSKESKKALA